MSEDHLKDLITEGAEFEMDLDDLKILHSYEVFIETWKVVAMKVI